MTESTGIANDDTGLLGVRHLKRYWHRHTLSRTSPPDTRERMLDRIVIHSLGIGLEQAARFLVSERTFAEFEEWILAMNGGGINPMTIRRINAIVNGEPYDDANMRAIEEIDVAPPVLTDADCAMWERDGVVILHDAISPADCIAAADAVYETVGADPNDPATWYRRMNCQGIMVQLFQHPALTAARKSRRIHKAFAQLWGSADLVMTTDRCGFNPPESERFTFHGPYLHWDMDAEPPSSLSTQAILYLTDTNAEQGAFSCVLGFHKRIEAWSKSNTLERCDLPFEAATPIAGKAGDLIIWHHALPHGSRPNRAARPRVVQYLRMMPARPSSNALTSTTPPPSPPTP